MSPLYQKISLCCWYLASLSYYLRPMNIKITPHTTLVLNLTIHQMYLGVFGLTIFFVNLSLQQEY